MVRDSLVSLSSYRGRRTRRLLGAAVLFAMMAVVGLPGVASGEPPQDDLEALVDVGGHRLYVRCTGPSTDLAGWSGARR